MFINGVLQPQAASSGITAPGQLYINAGAYPAETPNFGVLEYIGWTRALSTIDLYEMSQYLARPSLLALASAPSAALSAALAAALAAAPAAHMGVPRRRAGRSGRCSAPPQLRPRV